MHEHDANGAWFGVAPTSWHLSRFIAFAFGTASDVLGAVLAAAHGLFVLSSSRELPTAMRPFKNAPPEVTRGYDGLLPVSTTCLFFPLSTRMPTSFFALRLIYIVLYARMEVRLTKLINAEISEMSFKFSLRISQLLTQINACEIPVKHAHEVERFANWLVLYVSPFRHSNKNASFSILQECVL